MKIHSVKTGEHYCVECDISFKSEYSLKNHLDNSFKHKDPSLLRYVRFIYSFYTVDQYSYFLDSNVSNVQRSMNLKNSWILIFKLLMIGYRESRVIYVEFFTLLDTALTITNEKSIKDLSYPSNMGALHATNNLP